MKVQKKANWRALLTSTWVAAGMLAAAGMVPSAQADLVYDEEATEEAAPLEGVQVEERESLRGALEVSQKAQTTQAAQQQQASAKPATAPAPAASTAANIQVQSQTQIQTVS